MIIAIVCQEFVPRILRSMNCVKDNMVQKYKSFHLTVGVKVVQQLKLSGSNVAEVNRLEQEEDELAAEVVEVKGGQVNVRPMCLKD